MGGGYIPEITIQQPPDNWNWLKWLLGIIGATISGIVVQWFRLKKEKK